MDSDKNNNSEPVFNDKIELAIKRFDNLMYTLLNSYYFYSIFVSSLYSFITIDTKTVYDLNEYFINFIINFVLISLIALILSFIVDIFTPKGEKFIKIYFWTLLLISSFIVIFSL